MSTVEAKPSRRAAPTKKSKTSKPSKAENGSPAKAAATGAVRARRDAIVVRGAKEHNLKDIDVSIPRDKLVVITGLSGSGKSSLAFDTIFAEGQRKYMESLSAYARQFLDQLKKPDVEEIEGIPPTIAIEQRGSQHNPRSTVATTTEIYDYIRLLFARCGTPHSWAVTKEKKDGTVLERSGAVIEASSASQIVDHVMGWAPIDAEAKPPRLMVMAPVVRGKKGHHKEVFEDLSGQGWQRARVNGDIVDLRDVLKEGGDNPLKLGRYHKHTIEAVIDRLSLKPDSRQRMAESVEAALRLAEGTVIVSLETKTDDGTTWTDHAFSEHYADPDHPEISLEELSPRLFSFNSPYGACPSCHGLGSILEFDEALLVPDPEKPINKGGFAPFKMNTPGGMYYHMHVKPFCRRVGIDVRTPVGSLDESDMQMMLHGDPSLKWKGIIELCRVWFDKTDSQWAKDHLHQYQTEAPCPTCHGDRLRIEALHVLVESEHAADTEKALSETVIGRGRDKGGKPLKVDGRRLNASELARLNITDAIAFVEKLKLTKEQEQIAEPIVREILNRLRFLASVGLEYLSLDRRTATLSGGEAQRIRLATQVGSGLVGACYVLDEPTIGLHQRDNDRLIKTLRHLCDIGNTVLVVEHDEDMIRAADHLLDIGPGPGVHGGTVVAQGTVEEVARTKGSVTAEYLSGRRKIEVPASRRTLSEKKAVTVKGARENNLKKVDASFPLGGIVCVTGVSGSGKSTLVNDILLKSVKQHLRGGSSRERPGAHTRVNGLHHVDRIIEVDQSPIGRTPRSNPATYTGIFDEIRKVFTLAKESKVRGYKPGRFSFNVASKSGGGRCEACQGQGLKRIEMHFLPDVFVECEVCQGKRYNRETLEVLYRGKSIADVLAMTVEDACEFFEAHPKILRFVECLRDVGLGYIELGQPSTTLSGGEAQRVKLATELGKGVRHDGTASAEHTLYVLDEPTTGLHFEDIRKLIEVLGRLAEAENTLVIIEHNLDVIKCADWLVDLGPEGGDNGGTIVATGTPEDVAKVAASHTGRYLKPMLR